MSDKKKGTVIKGTPGLVGARVVADKPQHIKDKEEEEKKKRIKDASRMLPWPAGSNMGKKPRRVENGGRLKRR